ncbi:TPA: hypothetical protein ACSPVW_001393 [Campylobacter coli]|uniref:hypothetical protein n=1 Tax=Campylobacter coli TaxID=195 RepID=UPI000B1AB4F2|nr:hypothetical protein [Campylobacter coli]EAI6902319.1 hypothetical protein [Campylobacter coli]ECK8126754.1 hypothetical protein [Campylobacter coli]ECP9101179.1 hypothetical protein [Campylobacter coli]ECQ6488506.1 hypothetical protein [Campylobacter coli]ECR5805891.1 hypothetical protein [Campylobacter coli]
MEILLTIIPRVFYEEMITSSLILYFTAAIYLATLSILFMYYKEKNNIPHQAVMLGTFIFCIIFNGSIIYVICSFIFQYYTTEMPCLFLWKIFIFIMIISYVLIFLLFPQFCFGGLIIVIFTAFGNLIFIPLS